MFVFCSDISCREMQCNRDAEMQECLCFVFVFWRDFLCLYFILILVAGRCNRNAEMQECLCFVFVFKRDFLCLCFVLILVAGRCNINAEMQECL